MSAPKSLPNDERITLDATFEWCRRWAAVFARAPTETFKFDLDVAASDRFHRADRYYTKHDSGLAGRWWGHAWCNPPYSQIPFWLEKAERELHAMQRLSVKPCQSVTLLLPANRTEQPWWQKFIEPWRDRLGVLGGQPGVHITCPMTTLFLPKRHPFGTPRDPLAKTKKNRSPKFGLVMVHWRRA